MLKIDNIYRLFEPIKKLYNWHEVFDCSPFQFANRDFNMNPFLGIYGSPFLSLLDNYEIGALNI